jgi:hypothetical protein
VFIYQYLTQQFITVVGVAEGLIQALNQAEVQEVVVLGV